MKEHYGADEPFTREGVTIIPLFRSRTTVFPGGGAGEKEPLGILIQADNTLTIVTFTGSYAWWDDIVNQYPILQGLKPEFPETESF